MTKPVCSLSLDLDNQWSYMKTHGDPGWEVFPSYLDIVVPRILEILKQRDWKITFFIVGQDAALEKNQEALQLIPAAGHEIGNHSFHHEPWLHLYDESQTEDEITRAEDAIAVATGVRPRGFRGPGYSFSRTTLMVLQKRGYRFDASTLPTFLGPLARAYYFMTSSFSHDERQQRKELFGGIRDGLNPIRPYLWNLGRERLLEIPVTTMPFVKLPFHFSYLLYMSTFSVSLSSMYFRTALRMCRLTGVEPSLLLHPLDFLGCDDLSDLEFFPAMTMESGQKLEFLHRYFQALSATYKVLPIGDHGERLNAAPDLRQRRPSGA